MRLIRLPESKHSIAGKGNPCIICGRDVKNVRWRLHIVNGGNEAIHPDDEWLNESSDLYWLPIGVGCLRKYPELKPFVRSE